MLERSNDGREELNHKEDDWSFGRDDDFFFQYTAFYRENRFWYSYTGETFTVIFLVIRI